MAFFCRLAAEHWQEGNPQVGALFDLLVKPFRDLAKQNDEKYLVTKEEDVPFEECNEGACVHGKFVKVISVTFNSCLPHLDHIFDWDACAELQSGLPDRLPDHI